MNDNVSGASRPPTFAQLRLRLEEIKQQIQKYATGVAASHGLLSDISALLGRFEVADSTYSVDRALGDVNDLELRADRVLVDHLTLTEDDRSFIAVVIRRVHKYWQARRRRLKDPDSWEDCAQETLAALVKNFQEGKVFLPLRIYVCVVAGSTGTDLYRRSEVGVPFVDPGRSLNPQTGEPWRPLSEGARQDEQHEIQSVYFRACDERATDEVVIELKRTHAQEMVMCLARVGDEATGVPKSSIKKQAAALGLDYATVRRQLSDFYVHARRRRGELISACQACVERALVERGSRREAMLCTCFIRT